jgi:hypothetical protein
MKYILSAIIFISILLGCGEKNKETVVKEQIDKYAFDTADIKTVPIKETNQNYRLYYNLEKNKTYNYRISVLSTNKQKLIMPDTTLSQTINQTSVYLAGFNLKNIDKDSTLEIGCNISSIKLNINSDQNSASYESGVTPDSVVKQKFAEYDALINNEFSIRISKYGEISEIFRVDNIVNKYLNTKGIADSVSGTQKDQMRMGIIEGLLKPLVIQVFRQFPKKPVGVDSTWSFSQPPAPIIIFKSQNTTTFKLTNLEKTGDEKLAVIKAGLITNITGKNTMTDKGIVYEFKKPVTDAGGKIYFNLSRGVIQKSKTSIKVHISFSMETQTPQGKQKGNREEETNTTNVVELL